MSTCLHAPDLVAHSNVTVPMLNTFSTRPPSVDSFFDPLINTTFWQIHRARWTTFLAIRLEAASRQFDWSGKHACVRATTVTCFWHLFHMALSMSFTRKHRVEIFVTDMDENWTNFSCTKKILKDDRIYWMELNFRWNIVDRKI